MDYNLILSLVCAGMAGDIGDREDLPFVLSWCFIRTYGFSPQVNHELNKYNLEIRELL